MRESLGSTHTPHDACAPAENFCGMIYAIGCCVKHNCRGARGTANKQVDIGLDETSELNFLLLVPWVRVSAARSHAHQIVFKSRRSSRPSKLAVEPVHSQPFSASHSREQGKIQGISKVSGRLAALRSAETAIPRQFIRAVLPEYS